MKPKALVLTGAGLNCERESASALTEVGFDAKIVHIVDLLENPKMLDERQLMLFSGGFSYGDHAGAGFVLAEELRRIEEVLNNFIARDRLMIGICNGCQVLLRLGLLSGSAWGFRANKGGHYECRWVELEAVRDTAFFAKGDRMPIPVAHGEGQLFGGDDGEIALRYVTDTPGQYPQNPNGADRDAAGVTAYDGRVLAMMPHPERGFFNWQRPNFTALRETAKRKQTNFNPEGRTEAAEIFANAYRALA